MPIQRDSAGNVVAWASGEDVRDRDQRLFEINDVDFSWSSQNPGNLTEYLDDICKISATRIHSEISTHPGWLSHQGDAEFQPDLVLSRHQDFLDLNVCHALSDYVLPKIADFGNPDSSEVNKITYYEARYNRILESLMGRMDWYDTNQDGVIADTEHTRYFRPSGRTRGLRRVIQV